MKRRIIIPPAAKTILPILTLCVCMMGMLTTAGSVRTQAIALSSPPARGPQPPSQPEPCPEMNTSVKALSISPTGPAASHTVKIAWDLNLPQCFNLESLRLRGRVFFVNGQSRIFGGVLSATQNIQQLSATGLNQAVSKVQVVIEAVASRQAIGAAALNEPSPPLLVSSCTQYIPLQITQAILDGLQPAPNRPGQDFFPKIKVDWQTPNLPACLAPASFEVKIEMMAKGKLNEKTVTVPGAQRTVTAVFNTIAVGAGFTPDSISTVIRTTGKATITATALKEIQVP